MKIAILGGGQLARMLAMAAHRLGVEPWVVDPKPDAPAAVVANHLLGALDDPTSLQSIVDCDVVTAESDHTPDGVLEQLEREMPVRPRPLAFTIAGDRLREKQMCAQLELATAPFAAVDTPADVGPAISEIGTPSLLKSRFGGYDGKGQRRIENVQAGRDAFDELAGKPAILEGLVDFEREVSFLAVRGLDGEIRFWDPVENVHRDGVLRHSQPRPGGLAPDLERQGQHATTRILEEIDYVGVLAVEFFEADGRLLVNEIACRVHNSGHWTIEGARTSQFENHVRAVLGLPLGDTGSLGPCAMVNLLGEVPDPAAWLRIPGARLHLYGKSAAPGRKLGHVTLRSTDPAELEANLQRALELAERSG